MRFSTTLALAVVAAAASALPSAAATLTVPQKYATIQAAVNAAKPGDTVLISPKPKGGVYNEAVTIRTANLVLQGKNNPVLDGTGLGRLSPPDPPFTQYLIAPSGVDIEASHIAVRGLTVQNYDGNGFSPTAAINVGNRYDATTSTYVASNDIEISGCTVQKNYQGIAVEAFIGDGFTTGGYTRGFRILNNLVTTNQQVGISADGGDTLISCNRVLNNGSIGIDAPGFFGYYTGDGLTVTGNEVSGNGYYGISVNATSYDPSTNDPQYPNPAPTTVALNNVHDNLYYGIDMGGTATISGNAVTHNTGYGIHLNTDYGMVEFNVVTRTIASQYAYPGGVYEAGVGIYADTSYYGGTGIYANSVSANASDGIVLDSVDGFLVSGNLVFSNLGIGIEATIYAGSYVPNVISYNVAKGNAPVDLQDDSLVEGYTTINVWTKNVYGKSNPDGLSK